MNLLSNSCQQTAKVGKRKNGPTHKSRYHASANFFYIIAIQPFSGVDEMRTKNITVTVSVRIRATVRVSLVLSVSTNSFGASSVAICRRCVYKTVLQLIAETAIRSTVLRITSALKITP